MSRYRQQALRRPPSQLWRTFLRNHASNIWAADLFTVQTLTFRTLYVFVVIDHGRRRIRHWNVTEHPIAPWIWRQLARELVREVRVLDRNLVANGRRLEAALRVQGSALTRIPGVGVILAAKIVGRSGAVSRFPSRARTTPATRGRRRLRCRAGRSNAIASAAVETAS